MPAQQQAFVRRADLSKNEPKTSHNTPVKPKEVRESRSKSFHFGEVDDPYSNTKIKDKVLQWQKLAAEESAQTPQNAVDEIDSPRSPAQRHENYSPKDSARPGKTKHPNKDLQPITAPAPVPSRQSPSSNPISGVTRLSNAPKKRVVSDEHWRKKLTVAASGARGGPAVPQGALDVSQNHVPKQEERIVAPRYDAWVRPRQTQVKAAKIIAEKSKSKSPKHISPHAKLGNIRLADTGSLSPQAAKSAPGLDVDIEEDASNDLAVRKRRVSSTKNPLPLQNDNGKDQSKPFRAASAEVKAGKTKTTPGSTPTSGTQNPALNRIEAWLGGTQDLFIDSDSPYLSARSPKTATGGSETDGRPVLGRWGRHGTRRDGSSVEEEPLSARRKHQASMDLEVSNQYPPDLDAGSALLSKSSRSSLGSPTLKRSGAHRSHHSLRPLQEERDNLHAHTSHPRVPRARAYDGPSQDQSKRVETRQTIKRPKIKRKTTSEADLMSVLSVPQNDVRALQSAWSIRSGRARTSDGTGDDLMKGFKAEETKYLRELRTLVDGVIPVLLSSTLSKSKSFTSSGPLGANGFGISATTPIVNMGVALERLKSAHSRVPVDNPDHLITWAQVSHSIYADYLKAWRLGFQDVVVNLAPSEDAQKSTSIGIDRAICDRASSRETKQDVSQDHTEKVDVAFLLKRPLVRLKYLTKTLRGIDQLQSSSSSGSILTRYQELVSEARRRTDEEKARLEDETAANIDTTRARNLKTLAPIADVVIDPSLCVGARDLFDLSLQHSNGQRVDCRVELIYRDDRVSAVTQGSGDILVCEVDGPHRWVLLPPIRLDRISARYGSSSSELIVMIRGTTADNEDWHEVLSLASLAPDVEGSCKEWLEMLGTHPVPPRAPSTVKFEPRQPRTNPESIQDLESVSGRDAGIISATEDDIPIGEQSSTISQKKRHARQDSSYAGMPLSPHDSTVIDFAIADKKSRPTSMPLKPASTRPETTRLMPRKRLDGEERHEEPASTLHKFGRVLGFGLNGSSSMSRGLPDHYSAVGGSLPSSPITKDSYRSRRPLSDTRSSSVSTKSQSESGYSVWLPSEDLRGIDQDASLSTLTDSRAHPTPLKHNSPSAAPKGSRSMPSNTRSSPLRQEEASYSDYDAKYRTKRELRGAEKSLAPLASPDSQPTTDRPQDLSVAQTPTRRMVGHQSQSATPNFSPPISAPNSARRSSSPLKHEYAPSSSSEASSDHADVLFDDDDERSVTSESSAEDIVPPLPPLSALKKGPYRAPPSSAYSRGNAGTLMASQSASLAPFRTAPDSGTSSLKMIASIYSWSENGFWDPLHPDECSIIVTPGLIEAFEMSAAHSLPANYRSDADESQSPEKNQSMTRPLIGLELTPLVLLRRGTAIDISIRSPPTAISQLKPGNNIMFRSRNNQECDTLYGMINQARINNPTYIALQNARGPFGQSNWGTYMDQQAASRTSGSWWRNKRSSYRATSTRRTNSVAQQTESSVASMSSAISALKRFSTGNRMFNVAKSTISSRGGIGIGSRSSTTFSSSSGGKASGSGGTSGKSGSSTPVTPVDGATGAPTSITDAKVRMYAREAASRWRDMGSARLSIMHPPRPPGQPPQLTKDGKLKQEKRIVITGKTRGETLLDVTLGEGSFERVARTGIAVSVWEQRGEIGKSGGVMTTSVKVFMIQMRSEADAAYTFSLVGRLRY
ncbi:MAG: hypothetical protein M1828_001612 [Chrysothrix sp. TS-e1954]|nr:MAG: hypothetical protein M1828_001612 [Chrysothrix sp. TS-e1954]